MKYIEELKKYITENVRDMTREPGGALKHKYIVPTSPLSPYYSTNLWDWDSWLASVVMGQVEADSGKTGEFLEYERGCALNFLDNMTDEGFMPICITPQGFLHLDEEKEKVFKTNMHKPVLAQHIAFLVQRDGGRTDWIESRLPALERFINCYLERYMELQTGLMYWQDDMAVGVDNDPAVFYRPDASCGSIYLNCLMYRELLAFGYLMEMRGDMTKANAFRFKAQTLADAINKWCWDERDGMYYSVDFALRPVNAGDWLHSGAPRDYPCVLTRIDSWSGFMALWAGIADEKQAARVMERARDKRTFACKAGVRSLSRLEKMYDLRASNNPSNWRGPVWGISNFMLFSGMLKYGYTDDATEMAHKTIELFGRDLEKSGSLHEYYNPDTGEPIVTHDFQNWNFLVLNMIAWLEERRFVDTF
ncbi:MAG: glycoside hydrolase family 37 [Clostridia bacterium]|nr:glycoside hydrolase family 37 [Clostridia bacterium]